MIQGACVSVPANNTSRESAALLELPRQGGLLVCPASPPRFFRLEGLSAGQQRVSVVPLDDEAGDLDLLLYDAAGSILARAQHPGAREALTFEAIPEAPTFLAVQHIAGPPVSYALQVDAETCGDAWEPNDDLAAPALLEELSLEEARLCAILDPLDVYELPEPEDAYAEVSLTIEPPDAQVRVAFYGASDDTPLMEVEGNTSILLAAPAEPGMRLVVELLEGASAARYDAALTWRSCIPWTLEAGQPTAAVPFEARPVVPASAGIELKARTLDGSQLGEVTWTLLEAIDTSQPFPSSGEIPTPQLAQSEDLENTTAQNLRSKIRYRWGATGQSPSGLPTCEAAPVEVQTIEDGDVVVQLRWIGPEPPEGEPARDYNLDLYLQRLSPTTYWLTTYSEDICAPGGSTSWGAQHTGQDSGGRIPEYITLTLPDVEEGEPDEEACQWYVAGVRTYFYYHPDEIQAQLHVFINGQLRSKGLHFFAEGAQSWEAAAIHPRSGTVIPLSTSKLDLSGQVILTPELEATALCGIPDNLPTPTCGDALNNTSIETAVPLDGLQYEDLKVCPGEYDFFFFEPVDEEGEMFVWLDTAIPGSIGYDDDQIGRYSVVREYDGVVKIRTFPGAYLSMRYGGQNTVETYGIEGRFCPKGPHPSNHSPAQTAELPLGLTEGLSICGKGEYYRYDLPPGRELRVRIEADPYQGHDTLETLLFLSSTTSPLDAGILDAETREITLSYTAGLAASERIKIGVQGVPLTETAARFRIHLEEIDQRPAVELLPTRTVIAPNPPYPFSTPNFYVTIRNLGAELSEPSDAVWGYCGEDGVITEELGRFDIPALEAGDYFYFSSSWELGLPSEPRAGLCVQVDPDEASADTDRTNNILRSPFNVTNRCFDRFEPNSTPEQATPIVEEESYEGLIICDSADIDRDLYRICVPAEHTLQVRLNTLQARFSLDALLFTDPPGEEPLEVSDEPGAAVEIVNRASQPEEACYLVEVKTRTPGTYTYDLGFVITSADPDPEGCSDPLEPNNTFVQANTNSIFLEDAAQEDQLERCPSTDSDAFVIDLLPTDDLEVCVNAAAGAPANATFALSTLDTSGGRLDVVLGSAPCAALPSGVMGRYGVIINANPNTEDRIPYSLTLRPR